MNKTLIFTKRNITEMARDPLSYVFCVAFPLVMLAIMSVVNQSIPPESGMTTFRIDNLLGGIIVFGHMFLMLFTALMVSQDRYGSFLMRLYASPMKSSDFSDGYVLPMILIEIVQSIVTIIAAVVISIIVREPLQAGGLFLVLIGAIPSAVMFIAIGLIFGTLFSRNTAPGLCSVIISFGAFVGGIWFDAEGIGGVMGTFCRCFPFLYATRSVRACIKLQLTLKDLGIPMLVTSITAAVLLIIGIVVFRTKMRVDLS